MVKVFKTPKDCFEAISGIKFVYKYPTDSIGGGWIHFD